MWSDGRHCEHDCGVVVEASCMRLPYKEAVPFGFSTAALRAAMPLAAPAGVGSGSPLLGSVRTTVQHAAQRAAQPVRY